MINAKWGNSLDVLAAAMFKDLENEKTVAPAGVFKRSRCIVVPSRIIQQWLQHSYLYGASEEKIPRVLMNCEFPLLNVFVNDWLYRMDHPDMAERDPAAHPFSVESMQWRIYRELAPEKTRAEVLAPLVSYMNTAGNNSAHKAVRRFKLAGRLAKLFDEYMVYRPEMVTGWERGAMGDLEQTLCWEPELWRRLTAGDLSNQTYLGAFRRMRESLGKCRISGRYNKIRVFGTSMMPRVYLVFFDILSEQGIDVDFYLFNPCRELWFDEMNPRAMAQPERRICFEGAEDKENLFSAGNALLANTGRGSRDFLSEVLDLTGGQSEADNRFTDPGQETVLHAVQSSILNNLPAPAAQAVDGSVQIHVCHSPMREVEVLKDHLLKWFTAEKLQPRQVQVQVSDMALYAPYVDAVFAARGKEVSSTIPYVIADRVRAGESVVSTAFQRLLELSDSRFTAPEVMEFLQCPSVREAFGIGEDSIDGIRGWLESAGIRWGRDAEHRHEKVNVDFTEITTWRHGLDRLLLGYVMGSDDPVQFDCGGAGEKLLLPCDCVEGSVTFDLGRLARFLDELGDVAKVCGKEMEPCDWADKLDGFVDTFFASTNETYKDVGVLKEAVSALRTSAKAAGTCDDKVPVSVVRDFLAAHLEGVIGGDDMVGNSVVFSALRPGSSAPREIMCLLGMGDGCFPRSENRPAYDLFRKMRKRGDRSQRIEDRMAFLEAVCSAGSRFYVSYTGFSDDDNESIPSSVLVREFCEFAGSNNCRVVAHRLQAFNPEYFNGTPGKFSYSRTNCAAARMLTGGKRGVEINGPAKAQPAEVKPGIIELDELVKFFKNPAEAYYKDILDVRLEPEREGILQDSEEFEPHGLSAWQIRDTIVEAFRGGAPDHDEVFAALSGRGLVPLARWGRRWFRDTWDEVDAVMAEQVGDLGTLKDAVLQQAKGLARPLEVALTDGPVVTGRIVCFNAGISKLAAVDFRSVKPRAANKLASWIRHVFACAAGIEETRYCAEGQSVKDYECVFFGPLERATAGQLLNACVEVYLAGRAAVPQFSPEMSLAYAQTFRKELAKPGGQAGSCVPHEAAVEAARGKWFSSEYKVNDDKNEYYRAAFGPGGPFKDDRIFAELALQLLGPLLDGMVREEEAKDE